MNIFDYLNSKRGSALLGIYAAVLVILVLLALSVVMCVRHNWEDFPPMVAGMFTFILTAAFGAHLVGQKISQAEPPTPPSDGQ